MLAIQIAAKHAYPHDGLLQRWDLLWQLRGCVGMAIERLPFNWLEQYFAAQLRVRSRKQCCIQDAPRDDGKQSRRSHKPLECAELARLDTAAAFEHTVPRLNGPASGVPGQPFENFFKRARGHRTQQHPFKRFNAARGIILNSMNGKDVHLRQAAAARARPWRLQSHARTTQRQSRCALSNLASGWHPQLSVATGRGSQNSFPKVALRMSRYTVVCCADQPVHSVGAFGGKQFVKVALAVSNTDEPRLCTT